MSLNVRCCSFHKLVVWLCAVLGFSRDVAVRGVWLYVVAVSHVVEEVWAYCLWGVDVIAHVDHGRYVYITSFILFILRAFGEFLVIVESLSIRRKRIDIKKIK